MLQEKDVNIPENTRYASCKKEPLSVPKICGLSGTENKSIFNTFSQKRDTNDLSVPRNTRYQNTNFQNRYLYSELSDKRSL